MSSNTPTHRDPNDYDLPHGDWLCTACAMKRTGICRSSLYDTLKREGVEYFVAAPANRGMRLTHTVAFYNKHHVRKYVLEHDKTRTPWNTSPPGRLLSREKMAHVEFLDEKVSPYA